MNPYPSTALRVAALSEDVGGFDAQGFADRYGAAFLVVYGVAANGPAPTFRTNVVEDGPTLMMKGPRPANAAAPPVAPQRVEAFAVPIARRPHSQNDFVSVGRLDGNDICFADLTVSKLHALIRNADGAFFILDGNSTNGTKVNGAPVGKRSERATRLTSGDIVQLASVTCTFMDAAAVLALAQSA